MMNIFNYIHIHIYIYNISLYIYIYVYFFILSMYVCTYTRIFGRCASHAASILSRARIQPRQGT